MQEREFDYLVVGGGPAGLSAASELSRLTGGRVVLLERGRPVEERHCPASRTGRCEKCDTCAVLSGFGGATGLLGGQFCFFPAGDRLARSTGEPNEAANWRVLRLLGEHGIAPECLWREMAKVQRGPEDTGRLALKAYPAVRFAGSQLRSLFRDMVAHCRASGVSTHSGVRIVQIGRAADGVGFDVYCSTRGGPHHLYISGAVVVAPGRSGAEWAGNLFSQLGVETSARESVDIGVRVEVPTTVAERMLGSLNDPKLKWAEGTSSEVRTLCWCRGGEVCVARVGGQVVVDGGFGQEATGRTSFSVVSRVDVPSGSSPLEHARGVVAELRADGQPVGEELNDFVGRRYPWGRTPSGMVLPEPSIETRAAPSRYWLPQEMRDRSVMVLEELDTLMGGQLLGDRVGRVYAPVLDKLWMTPMLDRCLMTSVRGMYVAGDATGLGRGIVQAIYGGLTAARGIAQGHHIDAAVGDAKVSAAP